MRYEVKVNWVPKKQVFYLGAVPLKKLMKCVFLEGKRPIVVYFV